MVRFSKSVLIIKPTWKIFIYHYEKWNYQTIDSFQNQWNISTLSAQLDMIYRRIYHEYGHNGKPTDFEEMN